MTSSQPVAFGLVAKWRLPDKHRKECKHHSSHKAKAKQSKQTNKRRSSSFWLRSFIQLLASLTSSLLSPLTSPLLSSQPFLSSPPPTSFLFLSFPFFSFPFSPPPFLKTIEQGMNAMEEEGNRRPSRRERRETRKQEKELKKMQQAAMERRESFLTAPDDGWLHDKFAMQYGEGVFFSFPVTYVGRHAIARSLRSVEFPARNKVPTPTIYLSVCLCVRVSVRVCMSVCVSVSVPVRVSLGVSTWLFKHTHTPPNNDRTHADCERSNRPRARRSTNPPSHRSRRA